MDAKPTKTEQRQRSATLLLVVFYLLAFAISWLGFAPVIAGSLGNKYFQNPWWQGALILPAVGPAVAAGIVNVDFASSVGSNGNTLIRLKRSFFRPVALRWWAITVTLSVGIMLSASLLSWNQHQDSTAPKASALNVLLFSVLSIAANPFEEIGWRGFAQATLQQGHKAIYAALVVGSLWAVWHIPLFFLSDGPMAMSQVPFWPWASGVIPQAILLAWLYNRTGYSLATVSVFHILGNIAGDTFYCPTTVVSAVRTVAALTILLMAGPNLGQPQPLDRS